MSFFIIIPGLKKENDLFFRRMIEAELKGKKYYFGKEEEDLTPVEKNLRQKWDIEIESFKKNITKKEYFLNQSFLSKPFSELIEENLPSKLSDK